MSWLARLFRRRRRPVASDLEKIHVAAKLRDLEQRSDLVAASLTARGRVNTFAEGIGLSWGISKHPPRHLGGS